MNLKSFLVKSLYSNPFTLLYCSVDSVLMSRTVDPTELLMDLGFGGPSTSILARIPTRFFTKSHVSNKIAQQSDYITYSVLF